MVADTTTLRAQPSVKLVTAVRRHWIFAGLAAAGLVLRVATQLTYRPAILYYDSYGYLADAVDLQPHQIRPFGYSLFLSPFLPLLNLAVLPLLNHLMTLGMAVVIYLLLARRGVRLPLAALASAPLLLSGYHLVVEQMIMADVLFETLIVAGAAALVWRRRAGHVAAAGAGLLFGLAVRCGSSGSRWCWRGSCISLWWAGGCGGGC